jgi:signal transduction histidine kinase
VKILLIDQDSNTLEKVQTSLTRAGYQVLIAAGSDIGLRLARTEQPNLIIMDLLLTGLEGAELNQTLKQDETSKDIPIFIITSLNIPEKNEPWQPTPHAKWQLLRYKEYLPKPVDLNLLVRKVDALLKPDQADDGPTGPGVFLVLKESPQLPRLQEVLLRADFEVTTYHNLEQALPGIYSYLPACLVIESDIIDNRFWQPISRFQERHPTFSLVLIQNQPTYTAPEHLDAIDRVLNAPLQPWQVVKAITQSLRQRSLETRVDQLSKQAMSLNWEVVESKQTLLYQNQELDHINRQLTDLSELKETLTGMLVHDLKAPLSAIIGSFQFMNMDPGNTISDNSQRIVAGGLAAAQQMLRMTHTLLDEQKLENHQLVFDIEPIDLSEPVEISLEMLSPLFSMHKVEVEITIDEDLPEVMADPIILQRVIENLLDNAIKYSPTNEVIAIKAVRDGDFVEICIADRGEGIPPEHREVVFNRFTQLQDPKTEKIRGGVGLGLAFCKLAVETMGGRIWVGSLNDIGTAFFFTLPLSL